MLNQAKAVQLLQEVSEYLQSLDVTNEVLESFISRADKLIADSQPKPFIADNRKPLSVVEGWDGEWWVRGENGLFWNDMYDSQEQAQAALNRYVNGICEGCNTHVGNRALQYRGNHRYCRECLIELDEME